MESEITGHCSINSCPQLATHREVGESPHWLFVVQYCDEHHREIELGTPVGPVGVDPSRTMVHARGAEEPVPGGGIMPSVGPG